MRATRRFVPTLMASLEARLVMSVAAPAVEVRLTTSQVAQSDASEAAFAFTPGATLHAGISVAETLKTSYSDGSTQTESILSVPDPTDNTVVTTETVTLRNGGGTETIVDTESFAGGSQPYTGTSDTHALTITQPGGAIETETYHDVIKRHKTDVTGMIASASGGIETWTSTKITHGRKTTTHKTTTEPNGAIEHQTIVSVRQGDLDTTTSIVTTLPNGQHQRTNSATDVTRVQPPTD